MPYMLHCLLLSFKVKWPTFCDLLYTVLSLENYAISYSYAAVAKRTNSAGSQFLINFTDSKCN